MYFKYSDLQYNSMQPNLEMEISKTLREIQNDVRHVKTDVDMLKATILEDAFLTKEEKEHLEKTIQDFKSGNMEKFVSLDKI